MATSVNTGAQLLVLDVETDVIDTGNVAGNYQFKVDTRLLVGDDIVIIRAYDKVDNGVYLEDEVGIASAQSSELAKNIVLLSVNGAKFSMEQQGSGSAKTLPWELVTV